MIYLQFNFWFIVFLYLQEYVILVKFRSEKYFFIIVLKES